MSDHNSNGQAKHAWNAALVAEFDEDARLRRWDLALILFGWIHLAFFSIHQYLDVINHPVYWHYVALWGLEVVSGFVLMRSIAGKGWAHTCALSGLVLRVWVTFLILSFAAVTVNAAYGLHMLWYKNVWTILSSFGFMMMAYLISRWFFCFAVQMALTGLLMTRLPHDVFLVYGISWCLAFQIIGWSLRKRWKAQRSLAESNSETSAVSPAQTFKSAIFARVFPQRSPVVDPASHG